MSSRKGLGRGIDALIPSVEHDTSSKGSSETKPQENQATSEKTVRPEPERASLPKEQDEATDHDVVMMKITKMEPNREQPRKKFDEDALLELAESIKQHGLIQPILVQKRPDYYEIIAGERRWRASKIAGLKEVPVIIKNYSEQEIVEISIIENIQREDLNPIEEALAYKRLLTEFHLKQDEVAEKVSKSRVAVTNSMRLLKLCDNVQQMVIEDMLSTGHVRPLLSIDDPEKQYMIAQKIFDEKLSVRDVEKLIRNMNKPEKVKKQENKSLQLAYKEVETKLKNCLGTKVTINAKENGSGKLEIEFFNHDDLERIMELIDH